MNRLKNNRGAGLIVAYFFLAALVTFSAAFSILTFSEINHSSRYRDGVAAFWLAEAGVNHFVKNPDMLENTDSSTMSFGEGSIHLTKKDSHLSKRFLFSTGQVRGVKRTIRVEFPAIPPEIFNTAVNVSGDIVISGGKSTVTFNDKVRMSGKVKNESKHSTVFFEDKKEDLHEGWVSLRYPDQDRNGKADEFNDFVAVNRNIIAGYPSDQVLYLKEEGTVTVIPNEALSGKKIIYVEGGEGEGNVNIQFNGTWEENQNLTIISTGTVTYSQANPAPTNSRLNIIAWSGYHESAALPGNHQGVVYTHGKAVFDDVHDASVTNGIIIARGGIEIKEIWSHKTFNYADPRVDGNLPPGFEGLIGSSFLGYETNPVGWEEI